MGDAPTDGEDGYVFTDAVFVISFSGQSPRMLQIVKQAKKAGVTIVTLTNFTANPMRSLADVQLYSVSRAGDYEVPQIVSTTSQHARGGRDLSSTSSTFCSARWSGETAPRRNCWP